MATRLREARLREMRLAGCQLGVIIYPTTILTERGFKVIFYNTAGAKIGELGSDVKDAHVSEIGFEFSDFGCGAFTLKLDGRPAFDIGYRTRAFIHPYFDPVAWFAGFVQRVPGASSRPPFEYSGFGFFEQLDWVRVTKAYTPQEISLIVKDIVSTIVAPNTHVVYNAAKVETTGYTTSANIEFDHTPAKDAIQTLADVAQNFEFGVDDAREFYFREISTTVMRSFWTGKHLQDDAVEVDPVPIRNKLYVKAGQIQGGGTNYVGVVSDADSIAAYGLREDEVTAPDILGVDDSLQWADYILDQKKLPAVQAKIVNLFLDDDKTKIEAKGKARLTTANGTEYTLFIKRVGYKISAAGISADLELGQLAVPLEQQMVDLFRRIQEEQRLGDKRTKQLY